MAGIRPQPGAVFVSVTQSFNTATSMGRLTLHMLLSFAQFEREVTAERIRDKVAASKRKGLWMGGRVPLGYEKDERTLRINEAEAETVRTLYALYRQHGTLRQVKADADRLGLRTKRRFAADGTLTGGLPFRRGHLHCLLTNPLYAGRIRHQRRVYEGQHPSIIAPELWDAVQTQLQAGAAKPRRRTTKGHATRSPLAGKLFDETGDRLTPSHTKKKNGQRLRYYVSRRLIQHSGQKDLSGWRLPAPMLEQTVVHLIRQHVDATTFSASSLRRCKSSPRCVGLDPVSWTLSERRIRCPQWQRQRSPGDPAGSLMTSLRQARSGWCLMRARAWVGWPGSLTSPNRRFATGSVRPGPIGRRAGRA